jgi:phosphoribosylcarboxyaminoimidazole (NCAIR) mutase
MSNEIIKESLFGDDESASNQILETLESKIEEKMESFRQEMSKTILSETTEEVEEDVAFVSVISECLENGGVVNVDLMDGERVEVNEDIASLLSEVHDKLTNTRTSKVPS